MPCVYALTTLRTCEAYKEIFSAIYAASFNAFTFNPKYTMSDFELSVKRVLAEMYPDASHEGCLFHFRQCIFRKIQKYSLASEHNSNADFAHELRYLAALTYVPSRDVESVYLMIINQGIFADSKHDE